MSSNIYALPVKSPLETVYNTTPDQMRSMVRDLALWMHDHGVHNVTITREPGTAKFLTRVDGRLA